MAHLATSPGSPASLVSSLDRVVAAGLAYYSDATALLERTGWAEHRDRLATAVRDWAAEDTEVVLLVTCQRVEIYATAADPGRVVDGFTAAVAQITGASPAALRPHLYRYVGEPAVAHLFAVAAGLDSAVIGEPQVLTQLRQALGSARQDATVRSVLPRVIENAVHTGRKVRGQQGFGAPRPSLADVALDRAAQHLGSLRGRSALVVGAGAMARLATTGLRRRGVGVLTVVSRTPATGQALAERSEASWVDLQDHAELLAALRSVDVVLSCTSSDQHILDRHLMAASRTTNPKVLIDLARPADIDPAVAGMPGVALITLRDLRGAAPVDELAVARAQRLVAADVQQELARLRAETAAADIAALRTWAHDIADGEIARIQAQLQPHDPETAAAVQHAIRRTVNKLLHPSTVRLKQLAADADAVGPNVIEDQLTPPQPPTAPEPAVTLKEF